MGQFVFRLPDIGEGVAEAEITAWYVKVGDQVREDQPLLDVMTDKATVDMTSPVTGLVKAIHGEIGAMTPVGSALVEFEVEGDEVQRERTPPPASKAPPPVPKPAPAAEALKAESTAPVSPEAAPAQPRVSTGKALAAPAVRARAEAMGIDLASVAGTGPEGRVTHADLDARAPTRPGTALVAQQAPSGPHPAAAYAGGDGVSAIKIVGLRRKIAEKMQTAKAQIPHFGYVEEVDVTSLEALRARINEKGTARLTMLPFFARAMIMSLPEFPQINSVYDDQQGVLYQSADVHLGIAAQTPGGLMVPVVRNAQNLSLRALSQAIIDVTTAAKDGTATREQLSGSTITISSLGPLGGVSAFPVINHPEVAILCPNRAVDRVVLVGGALVNRKVMNISTAFDHRIVDGFDAATFVSRIKTLLEEPGLMLLG